MRVHTNVLTASDIHRAARPLPGVHVAIMTQHRSSIRGHAFEVRLEGNGYARNSGSFGEDSSQQGATWDEWGAFMSALYVIDPSASWGSPTYPTYASSESFHRQTGSRFAYRPGSLPLDTHRRHTWRLQLPQRWVGCIGCSAVNIPAYLL